MSLLPPPTPPYQPGLSSQPPPNSTLGPAPHDYSKWISRNLVPTAYTVSILLFVTGTISILLRIYSRAYVVKLFGLDDWLMASILFFNAGQHAILMAFLHYGAGLHSDVMMDTDPGNLAVLPKILLVQQFYYAFMHFIIKLCILAFYLRLSPQRLFRLAVHGTIVFNTVCTLAIWLLFCFQCIPMKASWTPTSEAKCLPPVLLWFLPASLNIATDVVILVLPLPTLFKLQTSLRRRVVMISIMSVGGVSLIVSCLRLIVIHRFAADLDFAYLLGKVAILSAAELETMIVAANIPSYKALWAYGLGCRRFRGSAGRGNDGGAGESGAGPAQNKLNEYELTPRRHPLRSLSSCVSRAPRAPTENKVIGIDTEVGLHNSQEELCKDGGGIQVSRDFSVTSAACDESDVRRLDSARVRAYYDFGTG